MASRKFNILMFGARRAGKSSVLASMIDSFANLSSTTASNITIKAINGTDLIMDKKKANLKAVFEKPVEDELKWALDENMTQVTDTYTFSISSPGSEVYELCFKDIPGEWMIDREDWIVKELTQSQIILVAIDTPHLLEEGGFYSNSMNIMEQMAALISKIEDEKSVPRMLLFVPIKCEKYYYENRMDQITEAIMKEYSILLEYLGNEKNKKLFTVAITPILTMGGVVFRDFQRDSEGYVEVWEPKDTDNPSLLYRPKAAYYKRYAPAPTFKPQYCEQPVLYLLNFVSKQVTGLQMQAKKKGKNKVGKFVKRVLLALISIQYPFVLFFLIKDIIEDTAFVESAKKTATDLKTQDDGYVILQDPMGISNK